MEKVEIEPIIIKESFINILDKTEENINCRIDIIVEHFQFKDIQQFTISEKENEQFNPFILKWFKNAVFILEEIIFPVLDFKDLQNREFSFSEEADIDGSIYVSSAHVPVLLPKIKFGKLENQFIEAELNIIIEFSYRFECEDISLNLTTKLKIE